MIAYPARFKAERGGFVLTFPDVPEAITEGNSAEEAMQYAVDALERALSVYVERRMDLPTPSKPRGKDMRAVYLPVLSEAKVSLYRTMRQAGLRKAELARRMGCQKSQVDRLLDLTHASRMEHIEQAFRALGKRLVLDVEDAA